MLQVDTWAGMSQECREAVVQLPYRDIRSTMDTYLKRHKFCTECSKMVNKATWSRIFRSGCCEIMCV